jgi:hypothetical protein
MFFDARGTDRHEAGDDRLDKPGDVFAKAKNAVTTAALIVVVAVVIVVVVVVGVAVVSSNERLTEVFVPEEACIGASPERKGTALKVELNF